MNNKKNILFIHNKYLAEGGEDSVLKNEMLVLKETGFSIYLIEFNNKIFVKKNIFSAISTINIYFNFISFCKVFFFILRKNIKVLHVHNFFYNASPSIFFAAKILNIKTVFTLHNYRLFCLNAIFFRNGQICTDCSVNRNFSSGIKHKCFQESTLFSLILANANNFHRNIGTWRHFVDHFIIINDFQKQLLQNIGVNSAKIYFKPNFLINQHEVGTLQRKDYYFFAGRLQEEKGIRYLIEQFKLLGKKLIIAGEGDLLNYVLSECNDQITYIGQQSNENLLVYMRKAKAYIFPSMLFEGMPMGIIEAFSTGTIVIASESPVTSSMIKQNKNGLLYNRNEQNRSLSEIINQFEQLTSEQISQFSTEALLSFRNNYQKEAHLHTINTIYSA